MKTLYKKALIFIVLNVSTPTLTWHQTTAFWQGCATGICLTTCIIISIYSINNYLSQSALSNTINLLQKITPSNKFYLLNEQLYKDPECVDKAEMYENLNYLSLASEYEFFPHYCRKKSNIFRPFVTPDAIYQAPLDPLFIWLYTSCGLMIDHSNDIKWRYWRDCIIKYTSIRTTQNYIKGQVWKDLLLFCFKEAYLKNNSRDYLQRRLWLVYSCLKSSSMPKTVEQLKDVWYLRNCDKELVDLR